MHRSSDLTDEPSRFKQFAWEQWENQPFAVIFRPGTYGLDRYVVKRYVEQVLGQCERWKQLAPYFYNITPSPRAYTITSYEVELMQRILDFHLNNTLHLRISTTSDQLMEYDELIDFIRRAQDYARAHANSTNNTRLVPGKKTAVPSIPSIHSSYVLPPSAKTMMPFLPQPTISKTSPVKPILSRPPAPSTIAPVSSVQSNKTSNTSTQINGHNTPQTSVDLATRLPSNVQVKPNLISPPNTNSSYPTPPSSNPTSLVIPPELCPNTLYHAKIDGSGWVQINNVFLPFIMKYRQRLVPYQVLVSCKILESEELRPILTRATLADITLMNCMIRECKINNEEIIENAPLINVHHVLVGTKNLVYVKVLPKDNPTSKINRQYKSVLALRGGSLYITYRTVPFVCSSNHSYIPLNDILSIYPYLQTQLKPLARVPRTHELDFLQLVQMYHDEKELPSDTLLIDMDDLNQTQIIPSKNMTLIEHQAREKSKLEQQIILLNNSSSTTNKRKNPESNDNKQPQQQKLKSSSTPSNNYPQSATSTPALIRPPTGYYPAQQPPSSSSSSSNYTPQYQQNHWLSSNYEQRGRTRWQ
ncbi:unnamed protein product [Rotaria magnacalcarata]|uniref:Uncharacterized protein n=2 Tax=Rotaria magnacalcarata TaxID=392030 RepID=A0A815E3N9_9BILA|nr:unnamed protein product [Rotaria magnacalcarata]CAF1601943.1 unnamed protein product [Rotaria magnacalcarata]CAF2093472.1 unnamed protein product [Rotaria magnacalcarata]CAF3893858.1 unnamed protein product [Rotaria magnacalcarata]